MTSVIVPDGGEYIVNGNNTVTGNLTVEQSLSTAEKITILSTDNVDLVTPLLGDAALNVSGGIYVATDAYIGGNIVVAGDVITLGLTGSNITFSAGIASDVTPATTDTVNLGSPTNEWATLYANNISVSQSSAEILTAVDVTSGTSEVTTNTDTQVTMPDGQNGNIKIIYVKDAISTPIQINPDNLLGHTSILMTQQGDSITMMFRDTTWVVISMFGTTSVV